MFVVTGLNTKRRPVHIDKPSSAIKKQRIGEPRLLQAAPHSRRYLCCTNPPSSSSLHCVSGSRMTRDDSNKAASNRDEKCRRPSMKIPLRRQVPTGVRKFIPRPLILVERMKARQLALESSPLVSSGPYVSPESLNYSAIAMITPLSTHVTPAPQRMVTRSVLSSDSHSSSSVSFQMSSRRGVLFGSGFGMMTRSRRPFSIVTLGGSSSSGDTFVADSPCFIKQASKAPVPVTEINATNIRESVGSDSEKNLFDTGVSVPLHLVAGDPRFRSSGSTDSFVPAITSTPFASGLENNIIVPLPTTFISSVAPITYPLEQMPGLCSLTSRAMYPFSAPEDTYIVRLPNATSTTPPSNKTGFTSKPCTAVPCSRLPKPRAPLATLVNGPKPSLDLKRLSSRVAPPSPTLVLDGVFALPYMSSLPPLSPPPTFSPPSSPSLRSPRQMLFPRSRESTSRSRRPSLPTPFVAPTRTLNAYAIAPRSSPPQLHSPLFSASPPSSPGHSGESPRSKLARVLTAHAESPVSVSVPRVHQPGNGNGRQSVPPLVKGIQASNDPRTRCEIEGLRTRKDVCFGHGDGSGNGNAAGGGGIDVRGAMERVTLAGIGMVAKLRARWEREGHCG